MQAPQHASRSLAPKSAYLVHCMAALVVVLAVILLFLQAPADGAFYWSDAPRHALNGVFIKDLLLAAPIKDPAAYAYAYYARYPALTVLFYPPLFYFLSAPLYLLLGVSHQTALLAVFLHYVAFGIGCYRLGLFWLRPAMALLFALVLLAAPEIAFWGRQVMLEIPAFAFLVWSAVALTSYRRTGRTPMLYLAALLLVLAMYTKISTAFLAPVFALVLLRDRGWAILKDRHIYIVTLLAIVGLVPLLVLTLKFGQANVQSVTGIADAAVSRSSLAGWVWYMRQIPSQIGWTAAVAAIVGAAALILPRYRSAAGLSQADLLFWGLWFAIGYLFFSSIDLKEARHSVFILVPVIFAAMLALDRLRPNVGVLAASVLLAATVAHTVLLRPVYYVQGYAQAVDFVTRKAPRDSVVLFSGYRDGAFVFNMRTREDRRDLSVLRADKMLLRVAVRRELGVEQKLMTEEEIAARINQYGIRYVVMQPGFWDDLEVMRRFEAVLKSPQFKEVQRIPTPANHKAHEKELVIYENLAPVATGPIDLQIELPIINRTINSTIKND